MKKVIFVSIHLYIKAHSTFRTNI